MQEAKQAVELIEEWETIDVADALELLPPEFETEEVSYLGTSVCAYFWSYICVLWEGL
jgi:phosphatidylinositol 3-kinase